MVEAGIVAALPRPAEGEAGRRTVTLHGRIEACESSLKARWQNGHAAACKAAYAGSIPTLASTP